MNEIVAAAFIWFGLFTLGCDLRAGLTRVADAYRERTKQGAKP